MSLRRSTIYACSQKTYLAWVRQPKNFAVKAFIEGKKKELKKKEPFGWKIFAIKALSRRRAENKFCDEAVNK